jgi:hypothetical protein
MASSWCSSLRKINIGGYGSRLALRLAGTTQWNLEIPGSMLRIAPE